MMLWTEKYRPDSIAKLMGQEGFRMDAENWVELGDMPNLLLFGTAGVGKTAASLALAKDVLGELFDVNFLELNASDDRKLETVRTKIKEFASQGKIGEVPFRIILLDEVDGMTSDAQNALKRIMERYESNVRFILTANDRSRIIYPLQSRCANYGFKTLQNDAIFTLCEKVLKSEGHEVPSNLMQFIASFNGDVRRALTELQAAIASGTTLREQVNKSLKEYNDILSMIVNKEYDNARNALYEELLNGKTMKDICLGLHEVVIESEMDGNTKYKILRVIGEGEWRSSTMTPRILISWMVAQTKMN